MGASDFSVNGPYSYDDLPPGQTDPTLARFSIAHDTAYILPVLQQAQSLNPAVKFMANPWSPPAWRKSNGSMIGVTNGQVGTLNPSAFGPLAQYFVKFVQAYQAQGIPIYAITPQNEPLLAPGSYPGMSMPAADESTFIKSNLRPALVQAGLSPKIIPYDHNWDNIGYAQTLLNDPTTFADIAGTSWHCYSGSPTAMSTIHSQFPTKEVYETECSTGAAVAPINTIDLLMQSVQNWARTVELWNIALDPNHGPHSGGCPDCLGVVTIDQATGNVTLTNDYYLLGQFSKFVVPGAFHIASTTLGSLSDVAFKNPDGSKVVVAHNGGGGSQTFKVRWNGTQSFAYTLPAGATVTFTWTGTPAPGGGSGRTGQITGNGGKCVDVAAANSADGTHVQLFTCNGTNAQQWTWNTGDSTVRALGKCLDVTSAGTANGTRVQLWTCNGTGAQAWQARSDGSLLNPASGRCLDDPGANPADGIQLQIWDCNGTGAQVWHLP
jgi:glucosylceramidase